MKKFAALVSAGWQEYVVYRSVLWLEMSGSMLIQVAIIVTWVAVYRGHDGDVIGGYTLPMMITYLVGVGIIQSMTIVAFQGDDVNDDINRGTVTNMLVRPFSPMLWWFARDMARRSLNLIMGLIALAVVLIFFRHFIIAPVSTTALIATILVTMLAPIFHFLLFNIFSLLAFWVDETWGFRFLMRVIIEIAGGALIPLTLFPSAFLTIFNILPFKFLVYVPMAIYLGQIPTSLSRTLLELFAWLVALIVINFVMFRRGVKLYTAYGG